MYASGIGNEPIAQRMISHVWEEFRAANSDVEALGLRAIFFGEMMNNSEYYEYQNGRTAVQNRNSALNHYQVDALELGQSEDFLLDVPKSAITSNLDFKEMAKIIGVT
ncbi:uncharacterized protein LOC128745313 isoform X2 [Sabethes cyaneus]|uniref:uncharacterized protein LOC128745313 isoform X2 n=1 Tax=Sabethes cyaneus TaxID=53552 RepID=UPI00237EE30D|nr:uncharacterized protein LOC128745313 isoform X2 [Sabethes cyaneus]